ncbi:hypothetical protein VSA01S_37980 [Vibrio sagamiensis NBRC 104589]|uniref:Uncharacterized protein n=1 Tax=Vibrio sagamiensis NBRC 104589 TaxID=1219064 RepID=A0A511QKY0_9VIBR|nr:hypothetical protein VSA01S_37980 [Vibrio sagamiensis NBRC 104589]
MAYEAEINSATLGYTSLSFRRTEQSNCINPHHNLVPWAYHFDRFTVLYESNLPGVWRESPYTKNKPHFNELQRP